MKYYDQSPKPLSRTFGSSGKSKPGLSLAEWLQRPAGPVAPVWFGGEDSFGRSGSSGRPAERAGTMQRKEVAVANKPGGMIQTDKYEIGDLDIHCIIGGRPFALVMLVPKAGEIESEGSLLKAGVLPGMDGEDLEEPRAIYYVDSKMVADYWETEPAEEDMAFSPPQGSYSKEKGFTPVGEADERFNCAGFALDTGEFMEPEDAHERLKTDTSFVPATFEAMEPGKLYILAYQFHFIKVMKTEEGMYRTLEKNGISGIYEKTYKAADFAAEKLSSAYALYERKM